MFPFQWFSHFEINSNKFYIGDMKSSWVLFFDCTVIQCVWDAETIACMRHCTCIYNSLDIYVSSGVSHVFLGTETQFPFHWKKFPLISNCEHANSTTDTISGSNFLKFSINLARKRLAIHLKWKLHNLPAEQYIKLTQNPLEQKNFYLLETSHHRFCSVSIISFLYG